MKNWFFMGSSSTRFLLVLIFFTISSSLFAQQNTYFVSFKDRTNSSYSILKPEEFLTCKALHNRLMHGIAITNNDLPVNDSYVSKIITFGVDFKYSSKWFNGVVVSASDEQIARINQLYFVKSVRNISIERPKVNCLETNEFFGSDFQFLASDYGSSYNQAYMPKVTEMHKMGYAGKGVLIAVLDDGFKNVNNRVAFSQLFQDDRIKATRDFVGSDDDVYSDGTGHGTHVFSILAGFDKGELIGPAFEADFLLLRTENNSSESLLEEYNWVRAAEYADSAGADIISSSLGYNTFDNSSEDHVYSDLNGDKAIITIGADIAAAKGILVINAAGNEGSHSWKYILAPADGDSVLTIGGVDIEGNRSSFSSIGPSFDGRIKPDLVTLGSPVRYASYLGGYASGGGTSYATPVISGMAAGLKQAFPELSNTQLIYYMKLSASQHNAPDNIKGYGIPNFEIAYNLISASLSPGILVFPNPVRQESLFLKLPKSNFGESGELSFFSTTGQLIAKENFTTGESVVEITTKVNLWPKGIYIIKVITSTNEFTVRFLRL